LKPTSAGQKNHAAISSVDDVELEPGWADGDVWTEIRERAVEERTEPGFTVYDGPPEDNRIDHRTTRQLRGEEGEADGDR
jgi:hypothetical protein